MSLKDFRNRLKLLRPKHITHRIGGEPWNFYAMSPPMIAELRTTLGPVGQALSLLFDAGSDDQGKVFEDYDGTVLDGAAPEKINRTTITPASREVAELRAGQRRDGIRQITEALLSDDAQLLIGRIIADSLREDVARPVSDEDARAFTSHEMDISQVMAFLVGVKNANVEVFGPLLPKAVSNLRAEVAEQVEARFRKVLGNEETADPQVPQKEMEKRSSSGAMPSRAPASSLPDTSQA